MLKAWFLMPGAIRSGKTIETVVSRGRYSSPQGCILKLIGTVAIPLHLSVTPYTSSQRLPDDLTHPSLLYREKGTRQTATKELTWRQPSLCKVGILCALFHEDNANTNQQGNQSLHRVLSDFKCTNDKIGRKRLISLHLFHTRSSISD